MIKNHLLITFRNFARNKVHASINILGLSIGIASAALLFLYVFNELTYDHLHPQHKNLYSIGILQFDKDGNKEAYGVGLGGWAVTLKDRFESVQGFSRLNITGYPHSIHDKQTDRIVLNQDGELYWVESSLGDILHIRMRNGGDPGKALEHVNSMMISASAAEALFGDKDPLNQPLTIRHPYATFGEEVEYVVTGVFEDNPTATFFRPKYLLNIHGLRSLYEQNEIPFDEYLNGNNFSTAGYFFTYLHLQNTFEIDAIQAELNRLALDATRSDSFLSANGYKFQAVIKPFDEMHFDNEIDWAIFEQSGNKQTVMVLMTVGILILIIASINYMNLATARSAKRGKEVGLRKTLGSKRTELIFQFMQESALTTILSLLVAVVLVYISLPYFNQLAHKLFRFSDLWRLEFIVALVAIVVLVTVLGGSYPALYLSSFNPATILKGGPGVKKTDLIRKTLVAFQLGFAVLLTVFSVVIVRQMHLIQKSKLNEQGEQILSVRYGTVAPNERYDALKEELLRDKDLTAVTMGNHLPRHDYFGNMQARFRIHETGDEFVWNRLSTDFDFCSAFGLEIIAGRDFDNNVPADSNSILLNESAVELLNRTNEEVLGIQVEDVSGQRKSAVIGVVKNFPFQSAYHAIKPLIISPRLSPRDRILYVKLPAELISEKIQAIEATWKQVMPGVGFDYWFVDDEFGRLYKREKQVSGMAKIFALIALCITILGLYGLASYMAEQKTREIGVRKALGATVQQIVLLFMITFVKIFLLSTLVAVPVAWYVSSRWLETFVYRIEAGPGLFIAGCGLVFALMVITVTTEVIKAARSNPVKALRHE